MSACVFVGPTLPLDQARPLLDAEYLPPVRQGDVYRAVLRRRPRAVGIVDGYFHQVPSVWHKEILWAMAEGVHVFGSASMGALRAAELAPFGMRGIGDVFAAFRDHELEDDDEVAVIHGPPETGFAAASEAMVNIRRTLASALAEGVVAVGTRDALQRTAKRLFYPQRTYPELLRRGEREGLPAAELSALRAWLERGRIDQKRADARAMLGVMRELLAQDPPPNRVDYTFEHTTLWAAASAQAAAYETAPDAGHTDEEWLLEEVRLDVHKYPELREAALLRLLAQGEAVRRGVEVDAAEQRRHLNAFRAAHGLESAQDLKAWLAARDLNRDAWQRLLEREVLLGRLAEDAGPALDDHLLAQLRLDGDYPRFAARARAKRDALADDAGHAGVDDLTELRALAWYFEQRLGRRVPSDLDAYARRAGFGAAAALRRAVTREFRFAHARDAAGGC